MEPVFRHLVTPPWPIWDVKCGKDLFVSSVRFDGSSTLKVSACLLLTSAGLGTTTDSASLAIPATV